MPIVTYKGERATISSNTSTLVKDSAFNIANLIMFQKIANCLSIISFLMVASMTATGVIGYRYVTSENFKSQVMNEILGNVQGMMPKVLEKGLPEMVQPPMDLPEGFGI